LFKRVPQSFCEYLQQSLITCTLSYVCLAGELAADSHLLK